jgi:hypothetical protein
MVNYVRHYTRFGRAGFQYFIAFIYGDDLETLRLLAERVMPNERRIQHEERQLTA